YLPNTIDLTRFPYAKIEIGVHSPRLLWVRAFADIYNPVLASRVLKTVLQYFPNALLTMIGPDKGVLSEVKSVVRDLGISSHVNFLLPIYNSLLYKYFHTHHVYLNTTGYESFGVAVLEAACCGLPVDSFDVGEIPYLWQNEESIMKAPYGDVESMAPQAVR